MFKFINEKKCQLYALGINISIPEKGNMEIRYARVITQIQKLQPDKVTMFNNLRDQFIIEQRQKEEKLRQQEEIEEQKEKER